MNLQTLAKYSGCSVSTVSKAFSGSAEISDDTKNRIFNIAKELGCFEKYSKESYFNRTSFFTEIAVCSIKNNILTQFTLKSSI